MTEHDADREWSQEELRAHVRSLGITFYDSEVIPQGCKYLTKPGEITAEDIAWAKKALADLKSPHSTA